MEGSSESGWQRSDSSRGLNSSPFGDRNLRLLHGSSIRSSSNASLDSGIIPARKGRERVLLPQTTRLSAHTGFSEDGLAPGRVVSGLDGREVSLRKWLDNPERTVDALECLHIFSQIVEIVNMAHSQGIVVHNVRPSCFVMSSFNRVAFIESASCSNSSSDSLEDGLNSQTAQCKGSISPLPHESVQEGRQSLTQRLQPGRNTTNPSPIASETICQQQQSGHAMPCSDGNKNQQTDEAEEEKKHPFPMKQILLLETNWYTSPEEVAGAPNSCASDIYRLGVLLFEVSS